MVSIEKSNRTRRVLVAWCAVTSALFANLSFSAEFTLSPPVGLEDRAKREAVEPSNYFPVFAIEGKIEPGDFEKFEKLVIQQGMDFDEVYVASPGGDVLEAMKIGRLIRELRYTVAVPIGFESIGRNFLLFGMSDTDNNVCASSCFFIYVAGVRRTGNIVGIHRPFLSDDAYMKMDINDAFEADGYLRGVVENYLIEMGVPIEYSDRAFQVPSGEIEWLGESEIESRFSGYIPQIDEWLAARCDKLTQTEQALYDKFEHTPTGQIPGDFRPFFDEVSEKLDRIDKCKTQVQSYAACQAHYAKYREQIGENLCDAIRDLRQNSGGN